MKVKKGLSYVLGDAAPSDNHILPVNAMQYAHSLLYTGGRDGLVKVWRAEPDPDAAPNYPLDAATNDGAQDLDERLLRLETAISSSPLRPRRAALRFDPCNVANYNIHTDWINDVKLVHGGRALVTASSDLSLKLTRAGAVHRFRHVHTDYVKKLTSIAPFDLVVSGGLDGAVVVWDLPTMQPVHQFRNAGSEHLPRSIYALLNNHGHLVAAGGPSNTINIYDRRVLDAGGANLLRRLVGHQDTVRCLLMNSTHVLSGSSDTSVKLWDMRNFQVSRSLAMHDHAVWSLATSASSGDASADPDAPFSVFYLADNSGTVVQTDLAHLDRKTSLLDADFCFSPADRAIVDESVGLCTVVARADAPVVALCVADSSVFVSTTAAVERYHVPATDSVATYQYLRACVDHVAGTDSPSDDDIPADHLDLNLDFLDIVSHLSMDSDVPLARSVASGADDAATYTLMFLATHGGPLREYVNAWKDDRGGNDSPDTIIDDTPVEILLNPVAPSLVVTIAFNRCPMARFALTPKSVVAKRMLNNRRWVVALYANGDIRVWDVFACCVRHALPYAHNTAPLAGPEAKRRASDFDALVHDWQTMDTLSDWCDVEIRAGKLVVSVGETSVGNVDIYYDELVRDYPYLACTDARTKVTSDDRMPLGRVLLNSLFHNYVAYESAADTAIRDQLRANAHKDKSIDKNRDKGKGNDIADGIDSLLDSLVDPLPEVQSADDSIAAMLQEIRASYQKSVAQAPKKAVASALHLYSPHPDHEYHPVIPPERLSSTLPIIVFEHLADLASYREVCSFHMGELAAVQFPASGAQQELVQQLRTSLPRWVGQPLLYDRFPHKEHPKIAFQLFEVDYTALAPEKRIGGRAQKKIKRLPVLESSIKLTSQNMLRVNKILNYLTDKFELRTSEMKDKRAPKDWLVLECRGEELAPTMTLQTIKTKIWKSSSDIELRFRRRFDA